MNIDHAVFEFINVTSANSVFDLFFPWWTNFQRTPIFQFFMLPVLLGLIFWLTRWYGLFVLVVCALATWMIDSVSSGFIKPIFLRTRPYNTDLPFELIVRLPQPSGTSFPSSHSLDAWFFATFLAVQFPRARWIFFGLAFLSSYARVYCGVHYPSDVVAGAFIGAIFGAIVSWIFTEAKSLVLSRRS